MTKPQLSDIISKVLTRETITETLDTFEDDIERGCASIRDQLRQEVFCADCEDGLVHDPENEDYNHDSDGYTYCGGWMHCPSCGGTGLAFDVSPVSIKGESQESIGVQSIPALTSYPRHGASATAERGAETVALSLNSFIVPEYNPAALDATLAAMDMLLLARNEAAGVNSAVFDILDHAYMKLSYELRIMLTGGAL